MNFEWRARLETGGSALVAHAQDYDGHPTPSALTMDFSPRFASAGRLAVAAVLAFRPYIAGEVKLPASVSPELGRAITAFLSPDSVFVGPVDFHPKAMPIGSGVFALRWPGADAADERLPVSAPVSELRFTSAGRDFGHRVAATETTVPTNASLLLPVSGDRVERALPFIAAAVLLAEDFGVRMLALPGRMRTAERVGLLADLLQACGLSLVFGAADG